MNSCGMYHSASFGHKSLGLAKYVYSHDQHGRWSTTQQKNRNKYFLTKERREISIPNKAKRFNITVSKKKKKTLEVKENKLL